MLDTVFLQVLNMSYTASYVILAVLLVRLLLRKAPKGFSYALWSVVLFRLVCPWSFESAFSLLSIGGRTTEQFQPFPEQFVTMGTVRSNIDTNGVGAVPSPVYPVPKEPLFENIFTLIWLIGIATLMIYSVVMLLKLKKQLKGAVHDTENIYLCARLSTPFVMGSIRPRIYLPLSLSETEKRYILLHEQTHIRRFDHLIKLVSFFLLCVHWFNPMVWVAFFLSGRDMEMSCDETVIKKLGSNVKKEYSSSLLSLATGRRMIGGTPLAFGEGDTKSRIKNILNYKKPPFWIAVGAIVLCGALIVGLMANPRSKEIIMVNDTLYERSGKTVNDLPADAYEIGTLDSILHISGSMPERNFQGAGLDEKYAGNRIFQSGLDGNIIYLEDFEGFFIAFEAQSSPVWRSTAVAVSFPAHSENASIADETEPFTATFLLPNGWEVRQPDTNSDQGVGYFSSNFLIEMHLYHDDVFVGQIGFNGFEPYEGEIPAEDYYKTVYSVLRLGSMYTWDAYTPVNTTETFEAAVATVNYLDETEVEKHPGAMPDVPVTEVPGVLAYDKNLKVYMGIQFAADVVTQQQAEQIASGIRFTAASEQSSSTPTVQEERVYFENLPADQETLYQRLTQRGLREWQIHTLTSAGFNFEEMVQLSDEEIKKILAPGSFFMGDTMSEDEFYKLVDSGIPEDDVYILQNLGYNYVSIVYLTPEQMDFIFPNTELVDNLVALGYDRNLVEASGSLYDGGWETYKELLDEVFQTYPQYQ